MKRILTLLVALMVIGVGAAGAATINDTTFEAYEGDANVEDGVVESDSTLAIYENVDSFDVSHEFDDIDGETLVIEGDSNVVASFDGYVEDNNETYKTTIDLSPENGSDVANYTIELHDLEAGEEFEGAIEVSIGEDENATAVESWDVEIDEMTSTSATGTVLGIPSFFQEMGDVGLFLFYGISVGAVLLGAFVIYMIYKRRDMSEEQQAIGYAAISIGGLGAIFSNYGWFIVAAFVVLLIAAIYLYTQMGELAVQKEGTQYIE